MEVISFGSKAVLEGFHPSAKAPRNPNSLNTVAGFFSDATVTNVAGNFGLINC